MIKRRKYRLNVLKLLACLIPLIILLFVLYINFLPFGYSKTYVINIDDNGNIHSSSSGFYLEDLKGNKVTNLTDVYDYGAINAVIKSFVVLKNAKIEANIIGDDIYFANIDFNPENYNWNYFLDFTKGIPSSLKGTAKYDVEKECAYFNALNKETLYYPNSKDMFESGSFIVYVEWMSEDSQGNNQQIIGHYNWELWQNNNSVKFIIGRLDNSTGALPNIEFPIDESFFNKIHTAIGIYHPDKTNSYGYFDFWVDGQFIDRKKIGKQVIWADYNHNENLSLGWTPHNYGNSSYYTGCIYKAGFDYEKIEYNKNEIMQVNNQSIKITVLGTGKPKSIKINLNK